MNTLEKREAAASKGAAILDLVQRYREKVPVSPPIGPSSGRWLVFGGVRWSCFWGWVCVFLEDLPGLYGEFRLVAGEKVGALCPIG